MCKTVYETKEEVYIIMRIKIGIDAGSTSTKLAAVRDNEIIGLHKVKSTTTDCDIYEVFDEFIANNGIEMSDIESIQLTGVGAAGFSENIKGINTKYIHEFEADAAGACFFAKDENQFLLISMGTGSTYLKVEDRKAEHLGGLGLGGGSLVGLSKYLLGTVHYNEIYSIAEKGSHGNVNIMLSDVATNRIEGLPMDITVSNFGKIDSDASREDIASGLINLVLENIIQTGCLMAVNMNIKTVVLIGGLSGANEIDGTLKAFRTLYPDMRFISTDKGSHVTAVGAAVAK